MATTSTSTPVDHTSDAGFRTWVQEIITMLVTTLGVTQTADTGQINTSTVTRPAINTMAGYVILRFNDAAQATSPIFIKLQFGTGAVATSPQMDIQLGTGSSGAGVLTGTTTTVGSLCANNNSPTNPGVTAYLSRACYNTTAGVLWLTWKLNGSNPTNMCLGGFMISRSNDATGAVTTDAVACYTNSSNTTGQNTQGAVFGISYLQSAAFNFGNSAGWGYMPYSLTSTLFGGNTQVGPVFQYTPVLGVTNWQAIAVNGELGINSTVSMTLVGSTAHTYIAVGSAYAISTITNVSYSATGGAATSYTQAFLWE